jgi:predicted Zn-dependent protease
MSKICAMLLLFLYSLFAQGVGYSPSFVLSLSEEAAAEIEEENGLVTDPDLLARVQPVVQELMHASDIRQIFPCRILDSDVVNAFALPAGPIYVTRGMLELMDTLTTNAGRAALAGILGHELAHVQHRHYVAWARLEHFVYEESPPVPDDIALILEMGYRRQQEFEADEYGVIYAMRAGYGFESIVDFYRVVRGLYGETPPGDDMFDDHPRITERIAHLYEVRAQIERDFDRFNFGVAALDQGEYEDAISHFRAFTSTFANSPVGWTNLGTAYLYQALSMMNDIPVKYMITYYTEADLTLRGTPEELLFADEAFTRARQIDTTYNTVYAGNMGIIAALQGDYASSIDFSRQALKGEEGEQFFHNNLGNALFMSGKYEEAADAYLEALMINEYWPLPRYNLALVYEKVGENALAIEQWEALLDASGFQSNAREHLTRLDPDREQDIADFEREYGLLDIELGMTEQEILKIWGEPDDRTLIESMLALDYNIDNIVIILRHNEVTGIVAYGESIAHTMRDIALGSTAGEVRAVYGLPDDIVQQEDSEQWVFYEIGVLFTIADNEVVELQVVKTDAM